MSFKGDSEKQALLRDQRIKKRKKTRKERWVPKILSVLKPQMKLLDIGCGTAHIIQELATSNGSSHLIGLDVSPAMLKVASTNIRRLSNVKLVEGDGFNLPFPECTFDTVTTRLADYSPREAYRVLRRNGCFLEYSVGPEADKEIKEFFPKRIKKENFFFPTNLREWKQEVCEPILKAGFIVMTIHDHREEDYYENEEELMNLI
jgi:ubiquinone/menaquinone biosynthesis C-methylase UbiE